MKRRALKVGLLLAVLAIAGFVLAQTYGTKPPGKVCNPNQKSACAVPTERTGTMSYKTNKTDEEWRRELTPEQYRIMRQGGTEPAFSGKYYHFEESGIYLCAACGQELFSSDTKYDSGSGWPSFWAPVSNQDIQEILDHSHGMTRTEVVCSRCGAHLGHVFMDGPKPTGMRYCVNSASLNFEAAPTK